MVAKGSQYYACDEEGDQESADQAMHANLARRYAGQRQIPEVCVEQKPDSADGQGNRPPCALSERKPEAKDEDKRQRDRGKSTPPGWCRKATTGRTLEGHNGVCPDLLPSSKGFHAASRARKGHWALTSWCAAGERGAQGHTRTLSARPHHLKLGFRAIIMPVRRPVLSTPVSRTTWSPPWLQSTTSPRRSLPAARGPTTCPRGRRPRA